MKNEKLSEMERQVLCPDCKTKIGEYHKIGCDIEICPKCKRQMLSCNCFVKVNQSAETIEYEVNHKELRQYQREKWTGIVYEKEIKYCEDNDLYFSFKDYSNFRIKLMKLGVKLFWKEKIPDDYFNKNILYHHIDKAIEHFQSNPKAPMKESDEDFLSQICVSEDNTFFKYKTWKNETSNPLFDKRFLKVLKFHENGIAPVCDESGWYHIDIEGNKIYKQYFSNTFGYYQNRAAVAENGNWFHLNEKGIRIYPENYAWCGNYQEDKCVVKDFEENYLHIDLQGNRIYSEKYFYAGDFKDGLAVAHISNEACLHIKTDGTPLNCKIFKNLGVFHKGFATAKDPHGWFHIDKTGNEIYPERYSYLEPFYNGYAFAEDFSGQKVVIDEYGQFVNRI